MRFLQRLIAQTKCTIFLRVKRKGHAIFRSPSVLPSPFGSETSSSQGLHRTLSINSDSLSWQSTMEDTLNCLDFRQRMVSCPLPVRASFSSSPASVSEEGSGTSGNPKSNGEQHLLGNETMGAITQSSSLSSSEASVLCRVKRLRDVFSSLLTKLQNFDLYAPRQDTRSILQHVTRTMWPKWKVPVVVRMLDDQEMSAQAALTLRECRLQ